MRLVNLKQWRDQTFEKGSAPDIRTLKRMVRDKEIPGILIGKTYYVDLESFIDNYRYGNTITQTTIKVNNYTLDL